MGKMTNERLMKQIGFIVEIDKLKTILRQSVIMDKSRRENDAEHTWHLAMMAIVLLEHANEQELDVLRVLKMLLLHDIVEIDAGDTFLYDAKGREDKAERENAAAARIFGMLPADQEQDCLRLWQEFEARETAESRYASAMDRLQPLLHNFYTEGHAWKKHGITSAMALEKNRHIANGSEALWTFAQELIKEAVARGYMQA